MKNSLDNNLTNQETDENIFESIPLDIDSKQSKSSKKSDLASKKEEADSDYTVDPITGEKYLKPKGDIRISGKKAMRLPPIHRDGYVILWAVSRKNDLQNLIEDGWEFVDPKTPGCENAAKIPFAGISSDGVKTYHRAMQMPLDRYNELMAARNKENDEKEYNIMINPAAKEGADFTHKVQGFKHRTYSSNSEDMNDERPIYNTSGMSHDMKLGYENAMR